MEEVEILCDRIIILDKGKIIAEGTSDELKEKADIDLKITVEVNNIDSSVTGKIKDSKNVIDVKLDMNVLVVTYKKGNDSLSDLINLLNENKVTYNKVFSERPTLNDVFLNLTGKDLRD